MERVKAAIEVHAGLIPGQPEPNFTRQWWITSEEWAKANAADNALGKDHHGQTATGNLLTEKQGPAYAYAQMLSLQPHLVNWVQVAWVWF